MRVLYVLGVVLSVCVVGIVGPPSSNLWRVPCQGTLLTRELICGGGINPGPDLAAGPPPPGGVPPGFPPIATAGHNSTNSSSVSRGLPGQTFQAGGRTVRRTLGDTVCSLDAYVAAAGLVENLCDSSCDGLFDVFNNYLIVYPPCKGLFLVSVCMDFW